MPYQQIDWDTVHSSEIVVAGEFRGLKALESFELGDVHVYLARSVRAADRALEILQSNSTDIYFGMDFEWKPDAARGSDNRIALIQISSGNTVVLIHCAGFSFMLPSKLQTFWEREDIQLAVYGWGTNDDRKLRLTYGSYISSIVGDKIVDVQGFAGERNYSNWGGLEYLASQLLDWPEYKNKAIRCSNWQSSRLSSAQIKYAALDALAAENTYRALLYTYSESEEAECGDNGWEDKQCEDDGSQDYRSQSDVSEDNESEDY